MGACIVAGDGGLEPLPRLSLAWHAVRCTIGARCKNLVRAFVV